MKHTSQIPAPHRDPVGCYRNVEREHVLHPGWWAGAGGWWAGVRKPFQEEASFKLSLEGEWTGAVMELLAGGPAKSKHKEAWRYTSCLENFSKYTYSEEASCRAQVTQGLLYQ